MKLVIRLKNGGSKIYMLKEAEILVRNGVIEIKSPNGFNSHKVSTQARSQEPAKAIDIEVLITLNDVVTLYEI